MKKYKLLKDIPGHKAGEIFTITEAGGLLDNGEHLIFTGEEIDRHPDIMAWFEEAEERWKPELGENYWYVNSNGAVVCHTWQDDEHDFGRYSMGNVFYIMEEAVKYRDWLQAVAVLRADTANQQVKWGEPTRLVWQVHYDHHDKKLGIAGISFCRECPFVFDNRVDANCSIDEHKDEWLIFLGVE